MGGRFRKEGTGGLWGRERPRSSQTGKTLGNRETGRETESKELQRADEDPRAQRGRERARMRGW